MRQLLKSSLLVLAVAGLMGAAVTTGSSVSCTVPGQTQSGSTDCFILEGDTSAGAFVEITAIEGYIGGAVFTGASEGGSASAQMNASFLDQLTVKGSGSGFLLATVMVDSLRPDAMVDAVNINGVKFSYEADTSEFFEYKIPITFGVAFALGAGGQLSSTSVCGTGCDFADLQRFTIRFDSFAVLDAQERQLSGYRYESQSGATYNFQGGSPVPEPATWVTLATGICLIVVKRLR